MAFTRAAGPSRVPNSRAPSAASEIMKRRDKPYRTEKEKVMAKKKRLDLQVCFSHTIVPNTGTMYRY